MIKDIAKSIKARLFNLAKKERLDYQLLVIRYLYERLLYRLSISDYRDKFYLKGGVLLYAFEKEYSRPTLDIDFLGVKIKNDMVHIKNVFIEICSMPCEEDGVDFDINTITTEEITKQKDYTGIRLSFVAHLDSIRQLMKMDTGFGDVVMPSPLIISYPALMEELPQATVFAYSLESVVAEKFQAMIELSEVNSRYKDFYDVYKILKNQKLTDDALSAAIHATFQNRNTVYLESHPLFTKEFATDEERNKNWMRFLKKIKQDNDLSFETVISLIVLRLEPVYKTMKDGKLKN
jgi:predicted nucleotidyltransferase component of viral defense system